LSDHERMSDGGGSGPLSLRAGTATDLPGITLVHNEVVASSNAIFSETPETPQARAAWFEERTRAGMPVIVASSGEEILGFASYGPFRPWTGYRETVELTLHVRSDSHRRGIGRALLGALVEHARGQGMHAVMAGIDAGNEPSIALHRAFGFVEVGFLPEVAIKHGTRLDLLLMQLLLEQGEN
jgi:L-amino acid N-acyltransferase YncA